jgi:DNA polymerase-3 subunit gamma/tau
MAKLGGENTPLLEISSDERARASRSALLFAEEDLTRFLQVMLRTFDELNYRQEPRFHLELGLMKLVHLQRLIPVEELLSQGGGRGGPWPPSGTAHTRPAAASSVPATAPSPVRTPSAPPVQRPEPAAKPGFSPFEADRNRKAGLDEPHLDPHFRAKPRSTGSGAATNPNADASATAGRPDSVDVGVALADDSERNREPETPRQGSSAESIATPANAATLDALRDRIVPALEARGHQTAAALMAAGGWSLSGDTVEVQLSVKRVMIGLVMNAEAEKIAKGVMRELGYVPKLLVVPGDGGSSASPSARPAMRGSVQEQALDNPLVKQAQELFRAEIRSVLDLRDKS